MTNSDTRVAAENIRTLYAQVGNSFAAAAVVTLYMAVTAWPYNLPTVILGWAAIQLASQFGRIGLVRAYNRAAPDDEALPAWGRRYTFYMVIAGLIWGSTAWLFLHADQPITVALTLCGLYGIAGGSVPVNAYNPPGLYAFVGGIFGLMLIRLLSFGDLGHLALGVASLAFAGIMAAFCRVQNRALADSFRIRFENAALVEALRIETAAAEAARAAAEKANLAKSQFLAAASHDLRQPLHALGLFAGSLGTLALDDEARDLADQIQNNVAAMERLFNTLLDVSRLDAGVVTVRPEPVSIQTLFARIESSFSALSAHAGVTLRAVAQDYWVMADPVLLEQIVANLVMNGITYAPGGNVIVTAERQSDAITIAVRDSGIGIAIDDQERIFDEFVQLGNAERDRTKGLGLGLAIAQRTARLLKTEISIDSAPGRGSCFGISLPETAAIVRPTPVPADAGGDLVAGLRLLLIDDDVAVRSACAGLFERWRVAASIVETPGEALAMIAAGQRFDVLICDYRLGDGQDGLTAIAQIQASQNPPPAACLLTGDLDPDIMMRANAAGVPLLQKPLLPGALRAVLNHLAATALAATAKRTAAGTPQRNDMPV